MSFTATELWTAQQCAAAWGIGLKTWHGYRARGQAPEPCAHAGRTPLWDPQTVRTWPRTGQGARTDKEIPVMLPALPADVPIVDVRATSNDTEPTTPAQAGIDTDRQWWVEAVRRPRFGDARVTVTPPGWGEYEHLLSVVLPADDADDVQATADYAVNIARQLVTLSADTRDAAALAALRELLGPDGPQAGQSSTAWFKVIGWLNEVRATRGRTIPVLDL
ncbi:hypothetical protein [Kitasatospora cheerisanensis]|uniref:DNA-binding protein n=1 Tax=Kitasatospora cheerisanensis KCTC 2395 TaxID=1348663 RepID=A0A066YG61_9ACTN|nr:hypothetical protein [Kitasatospora cheerisanensis]KDN80483.1 hypothetical protein KCH_77710 [Kitasatospora cheerisanensis KCTC 2395]